MLRDGLHDGSVHDDEVLGGGLDGAAFARVARVEEQRGALEAHPVALPAPLARQLDLVLLPQQPLLHAQEPAHIHHASILHLRERWSKDQHTLTYPTL